MTKISAIRSSSDDVFVLTVSSDTSLTDDTIRSILLNIHNSIGVDSATGSDISPTDSELGDGATIADANET